MFSAHDTSNVEKAHYSNLAYLKQQLVNIDLQDSQLQQPTVFSKAVSLLSTCRSQIFYITLMILFPTLRIGVTNAT